MATEPRDRAAALFQNVRARNADGAAALFAENAAVSMPDGRQLAGREAIRAMYAGLFAGSPPTPTPQAFIQEGDACAVELEVHFEDGQVRRVLDVFRFDAAGHIARLTVYAGG